MASWGIYELLRGAERVGATGPDNGETRRLISPPSPVGHALRADAHAPARHVLTTRATRPPPGSDDEGRAAAAGWLTTDEASVGR
jgi:hypothetical protein